MNKPPNAIHDTVPKTVTFNGETHTIAEWADKIGITRETLRHRLRNWTLEEAMQPEKRRRDDLRMMTVNLVDGPVTKAQSEWSRELDIPMSTISRRIGLGWDDEQALGFKPGPMASQTRTEDTDE